MRSARLHNKDEEVMTEAKKILNESMKESINNAVNIIGLEKVIDSVGLEKVIDSVGLEKVIDSIGLEKVIDSVKDKDDLIKILLKKVGIEKIKDLIEHEN